MKDSKLQNEYDLGISEAKSRIFDIMDSYQSDLRKQQKHAKDNFAFLKVEFIVENIKVIDELKKRIDF